MSSADEESFIILDETPSWVEPYSLLQIPNSIEHNSPIESIRTVDLMEGTDKGVMDIRKPTKEQCDLSESNTTRITSQPVVSPNLAESFLLGAIDRNTMMNSVSINFPSLVNSTTKTEDIERLQDLIHEHTKMKENLERSNVTMRQQFSLVNSWLDNVKGLKEKHQKDITELKRVNLKLLDENNELKQKLSDLQADNRAYDVKGVAENGNAEAKKRCAELEELVKNLHVELSNAIAEKLEFEDMKTTFADEIDCVQVNLVATEEMYKLSKAEALELKATNATLKQDIKTLEDRLAVKQEEISTIKAQLEVYKTDFELERMARQEMAGQKQQLATDLQLLQRRNQSLLDGAVHKSAMAGNIPATQTSMGLSSVSEGSFEDPSMFPTYTCPVCDATYANVDNLHTHVNECLEKSQ